VASLFDDTQRYTHVLVHYGEIALKKTNRPFFEQALVNNIRRRLTEPICLMHGRLLIELAPQSDVARVLRVLATTFGIANFARGVQAVNEHVGLAVVTASRKRVDLEQAGLDIRIEITGRGAYLYSDVERGPGGLPVGVSGKVLALAARRCRLPHDRLPPRDAAHRRADGRPRGGQGVRHWRQHSPGGFADARQPRAHQLGGAPAGAGAANRLRQE
jgi:hypothetical protein